MANRRRRATRQSECLRFSDESPPPTVRLTDCGQSRCLWNRLCGDGATCATVDQQEYRPRGRSSRALPCRIHTYTRHPRRSITPAPSLCRAIRGKGNTEMHSLDRTLTSNGLTPNHAIRTRTSLSFGTGVGISDMPKPFSVSRVFGKIAACNLSNRQDVQPRFRTATSRRRPSADFCERSRSLKATRAMLSSAPSRSCSWAGCRRIDIPWAV